MYSFNELQGIFEQELRSMKWPREPRLLYEPIAYSLEEGGKRIRPVALLMPARLSAEGSTLRSRPRWP